MANEGGSNQKRKFGGGRLKHGSQGSKRDRKELTRKEWNRQGRDRRAVNDETNAKRRKLNDGDAGDSQAATETGPYMPPIFSQQEIDAEERKPKSKVAVLFGYAGTGYKGLQIDAGKKTIEGSLFNSFVKTGLISKANANDPKKSALSRCARTDKGVHAAGNVVSLKLTTHEDYTEPITKLNADLGSQAIRVWSIQRTTGSFSSYQACDSRWYEYLLPTHVFLPPHPSSHLAKKLREGADAVGEGEKFDVRQEEVRDFWQEVEEKYVKPVLDDLPQPIGAKAMEIVSRGDNHQNLEEDVAGAQNTGAEDGDAPKGAVKRLKAAYAAAKRDWRITPARLARIQPTLDLFLGTRNYHAYTIRKTFRDPSAKRLIKSFTVSTEPILINRYGVRVTSEADDTAPPADAISEEMPTLTADRTTEWLSLKIHGQSFMMHQIRKMVSMMVLCVRCGTDASMLIPTSFGPLDRGCVIPKAPGLGLLLLNPVFKAYNEGPAFQHGRQAIDFEDPMTRKPMDAFTEREIYRRIWGEEMGLFEPKANVPQSTHDEGEDEKAIKSLQEGKVTEHMNEDEDDSDDDEYDEEESASASKRARRSGQSTSTGKTGIRNKDAFLNFFSLIDSTPDGELWSHGAETNEPGNRPAYTGYGYLNSAGLKALVDSVEGKGWKIGERRGFVRPDAEADDDKKEDEKRGIDEAEKEQGGSKRRGNRG